MVFEQDLAFERRMRPAVEAIFRGLFPQFDVAYTREVPHLQQLDDLFAVDTICTFPAGRWLLHSRNAGGTASLNSETSLRNI